MIRRTPRRDPRGDDRAESLRDALLRERPATEPRGAIEPPADVTPVRDPYREYDPGPRTGLAALLTVVEAGAIAGALVAASVWQATAPARALPAQARGLAAISEVDALIALHSADLQRQLDEGAAVLTLEGFPVSGVVVERSAVQRAAGDLDPRAFREATLDAGAALLYERGLEAMRAPGAAASSSDRLFALFIDSLTRERHSQATLALAVTGGVAALLALLLLAVARGRRWLVLGLSLAIGGLLALGFTLIARGALATLDAPPGAALTEYATVARALLDLLFWNALAVLVLGAALAVPGALRREG